MDSLAGPVSALGVVSALEDKEYDADAAAFASCRLFCALRAIFKTGSSSSLRENDEEDEDAEVAAAEDDEDTGFDNAAAFASCLFFFALRAILKAGSSPTSSRNEDCDDEEFEAKGLFFICRF